MTDTPPRTFGAPPANDPLEPSPDLRPARPDLVDVELLNPPAKSALDDLRDLAAAEVAVDPERYEVPTRPGWAVFYSVGMTGDQVQFWSQQAQDRKKPGGFDNVKWAGLVLSNQAVAIVKNGENPTESGAPLTFKDPELLELLDVRTARDAVRKFYGGAAHVGDGHMIAHAYSLLKAAGYDEAGVRTADAGEDPTAT